jgi:hypothetical protein
MSGIGLFFWEIWSSERRYSPYGQISSLRKKQSGKRKRENVKFSVGKQEKKRGRRKNEKQSIEE